MLFLSVKYNCQRRAAVSQTWGSKKERRRKGEGNWRNGGKTWSTKSTGNVKIVAYPLMPSSYNNISESTSVMCHGVSSRWLWTLMLLLRIWSRLLSYFPQAFGCEYPGFSPLVLPISFLCLKFSIDCYILYFYTILTFDTDMVIYNLCLKFVKIP